MLVLMMCLTSSLSFHPGRAFAARTRVGPPPPVVRFYGQVTSASLVKGVPSAFTLMTRNGPVDFRLPPRAKLVSRSAEAEVEGFQSGDYAIVMARRVNRGWVANRVEFDVQPITVAIQVTLTGTVQRVSANGKLFSMLLDSGPLRRVVINARTKYRMDGQLLDGPPALMRGDVVTVIMRRVVRTWVALSVNVRTSYPYARG